MDCQSIKPMLPWSGAWLLVWWACCPSPVSLAREIDFGREIRPLLTRHCYRCHSQVQQEGGLRLDDRDAMLSGGGRGPAIVPGNPEQSLLIQAMEGSEELTMPPEAPPLSADEIQLIGAWIEQGAAIPTAAELASRHWAFQPPQRPEVKPTRGDDLNPIDSLVRAGWADRPLQPAPPAPRPRLLRRLYLDLIGTPPPADVLESFVHDERPDAYERRVDALLQDPAYGERWGRHWMDVWRYSDWSGHNQEVRNSQPHIWRWRDWIIESLNANVGYDAMVRAMLAADELTPQDRHALRATGYLVRNWYRYNRNVWLDTTIAHTGKAFLGLTLGCARCHDHMYDPIVQEEYYRFRAIFEPHDIRQQGWNDQESATDASLVRVYDATPDAVTQFFVRGDDRHPDPQRTFTPAIPRILGQLPEIVPVPLPTEVFYPGFAPMAQQRVCAATDQQRDAAQGTYVSAQAALAAAQGSQNPALVAAAERACEVARLQCLALDCDQAANQARIAADRARYQVPPAADTASLVAAAVRAEWNAKLAHAVAEEADAALQLERALAATTPDQAASDAASQKHKESRDRLTAAEQSLAQPPADYTPFGPQFPATSTGRRTALATWITDRTNPLTARVAVNHIWHRHFGRPLVDRLDDFGMNSPAPQQWALLDWLAVEWMEHDWDMKYLHRLIVTSATYRRDSADFAGSAANRQIDPDNVLLWRMNARRLEGEAVRDSLLSVGQLLDPTFFGPELDFQAGMTTYRRSLYYRHANEKQMTFLKLFDAPNVEECYRRSESVTPQQALALTNSPLAEATARQLALHLQAHTTTHVELVTALFQQVLSRDPDPAELQLCVEFLAQGSDAGVPAPLPPARAAQNLVHAILNHTEFVTIP